MKKIIFILALFVFASCEKEHCLSFTDLHGDQCCVKCFRTEQRMIDYSIKHANELHKCTLCD